MIGIATVDRSATSNLGWLHRVSPVSKLTGLAIMLVSVIVNWNVLVVLSFALLLAAVAASARIDLKATFTLAAYPAFFALVFSLASAPDPMTGAVIVLKATCAGLAAITLVMTTPYPQIFAPVQAIVPGIVGDSLLMTYRATFLLADKFSNLLRSIRLRAGLQGRHPIRGARATTQALGGLLLYSFDLAQRDYDILRLRGYAGRLRASLPGTRDPLAETLLLSASVLVVATSLAFRLGAATLNPYSWLLPPIAGVLLVAGLISRRRTL